MPMPMQFQCQCQCQCQCSDTHLLPSSPAPSGARNPTLSDAGRRRARRARALAACLLHMYDAAGPSRSAVMQKGGVTSMYTALVCGVRVSRCAGGSCNHFQSDVGQHIRPCQGRRAGGHWLLPDRIPGGRHSAATGAGGGPPHGHRSQPSGMGSLNVAACPPCQEARPCSGEATYLPLYLLACGLRPPRVAAAGA
jgi:hypothetical protein